MKYFKLLRRCAGIWIMRDLAYKYDFLIKTISVVFSDLIGPLVTLFIYNTTSGLPGWTFSQLMLFQGTLILVMGLARTSAFTLSWWVLDAINEGEFDQYLLKPYPTLLYLLALTTDHYGIAEIIVGLAIVIHSAMQIGIPFFTLATLAYIILVIAGYFVHLSANIIISSMGFIAVKSEALEFLYSKITDFARYPLNVYGTGIRFALTFLFPIAVSSFYPAQALISGVTAKMLLITLLPVAAFFIASLMLWRHAIKSYSSAGG
ncbi:MAG: ABC-2 family transporter protein [Candidatus Woesearchaeota archaeon]|nr:ABC-2 family transporter protein [Candidatus Woesearchaeota archaeon]